MKVRLLFRFAFFGLVTYGLFTMIFNEKERVSESVESEMSLIEEQRSASKAEDESFAALLGAVDTLGISDNNLAECVKLNLRYFERVYRIKGITDPTVLTKLDCSRKKIKVLYGLENFKALEDLNIGGNPLESLTGIGRLNELKTLDISDTGLTSIWEINHLNIESLRLYGVRLSDNRELLQLDSLKKLEYHVHPDYDCGQLDVFFKEQASKGWYLKRPGTCLDQYGTKTRF